MSAPGKLGELLVSQRLITSDQLKDAMEFRKKNDVRLGSALIQLGHLNEKVFATFLSKYYGITAISLDDMEVSPEAAEIVPKNLCEKHCVVPLSIEKSRLSVAVADPSNMAAIDDLRFIANREVTALIAAESSIRAAIERVYSGSTDDLQKMVSMESLEKEDGPSIHVGADVSSHEVEGGISAGEKPVIRLINGLFVEAIKRKASDIHMEPFEAFTRVRFRIDGVLHEMMRVPPQMRLAVPARIKVMANMDISEKRLPQDGRIQVRTRTKKIDIRVSTLPTILGEKVVMRLLDQGTTTPSLSGLGFDEEQLKLFTKAASQPYGMVLVTGPTGSGKSTTLYAALSELNSPDINISTVEDPVEYKMNGVNQVQMKESIGLSFASALRSLLRQDPDIIMVGEIRDQETAEIAIKSALTGHMVFSTLHTNDAPSSITRLLHMGVEPFLITAALTLVQAQRLIRVICPKCAEPDTQVTVDEAVAAEMPKEWADTFQPKRGKGCDHCGKTGFKGRKGIFEVMYLTENVRNMVIKGSNSDEIKKVAIQEGMRTLRQDAIIKLYRGETTLEEVVNNSRPDGDILR
ncbi:MAG: type IV-A pilus assembly ATPase PilB [Deltaproteobacteria bacterium]|nr:type IV-A pilus assembly ATPase PilB [Deltaproteobacteria bacterium]